MKAFSKILVISLVSAGLIFSGCSKKSSSSDFDHASLEGNIPEAYIPEDIALFVSYSLLNDAQFEAMEVLKDKLGGDDKFMELIAEGFDNDYEDTGLEFSEDLLPALGEQARIVLGLRTEGGDAGAFAIATLSEPKKMEDVFDALVEEGSFEKKKLSGVNAYVHENDELYAALLNDLFLVANSAEGLIEMVDMSPKDSLWESDIYQDTLAEVDDEHVFSFSLYPQRLLDVDEIVSQLSAVNGAGTIGAVENQSFTIRVEEEGFAVTGFALMDKKKADDLGVSFDRLPKEEAYLYEEVPVDGLIGYIESFGLEQAINEALKLDPENEAYEEIVKTIKNYTSMDLEEEILPFMDKGYSFAFHQNSDSIFPGMSLYVDVSSDTDNADRFIGKIDAQLTGFVSLLDISFPGAVSRETTRIDGSELSSIVLDLSAADHDGGSSIPSSLTDEPMKLTFGLLDDRLLLTTANVWEEGGSTLSEDAQFEEMREQLSSDVNQGLLYMSVDSFVDYLDTFNSLQDQLNLGVEEVESIDFEEIFEGFVGGIAMSKTADYETRFEGFLMID